MAFGMLNQNINNIGLLRSIQKAREESLMNGGSQPYTATPVTNYNGE